MFLFYMKYYAKVSYFGKDTDLLSVLSTVNVFIKANSRHRYLINSSMSVMKWKFSLILELICEAEYLSVDPYMRVYVSRIPSIPAPMIGTQIAK